MEMNASSLAEDIGASLWTAIDNVYGTLIRKSDVFDIINTVVFEIEKRPLKLDDPGELSQKLDSVAISSRNGTISSNPTIPTAAIPEYQGFLRLLSPTPTLWEEDIQAADFTTSESRRIASETLASQEPPTRLYPAAPGIPHDTSRVSKKAKRRRRKNRRNQKRSQKATCLMSYPESLTIYFGNSL
ncbi:hypothetical protein TWF788_003261 [Orbilia oligospora]|uniref:Uncharacterized protein n=1 Tax=Orbilia oligospora TaxID=2813651 RepID=A0A7C8U7M7_ORBOL|nr:hypothetical protein TWF788_003261 [Orbilia oligospora]